jgi:hypothetical protein
MKKRLLLIFALLLFCLRADAGMLMMGGGTPTSGSCTTANDSKIVSQETGSSDISIGGVTWRANAFTLSATTTITSVLINFRQTTQCDVTLLLYSDMTGNSGAGTPISGTSVTITNRATDATATWVEFVLPTPKQLSAGTYYYVFHSVTENSVYWTYGTPSGNTGYYASSNSGVSWTDYSTSYGNPYQIWGCTP